MISVGKVTLADLFMLFIFAEVLGMVGAFYNSQRIPVTLPIIIAMTALTRMIILQSKDIAAVNILYESAGILILALSSWVMSAKDKLSLEKLRLRTRDTEQADH
jgi:protein PsiE